MQTQSGNQALLPLRNALFLGSYGTVVSRALQVNIDPSDDDYQSATIEKDSLIYRAHIGQQQYDIVLNEIEDSEHTHVALRAVRLLAKYFSLSAERQKQEEILQQLDTLMDDVSLASDPTLAIVATTIYLQEKKPVEALRFVYAPTTLEMLVFFFKQLKNAFRAALKVIVNLHMNLLTEAIEAQKTLTDMNDEATITLLTRAYILLAQGGNENLLEAFNIFQLLIEKFGETSILMNGIANIALQEAKFQEAETSLLNALSKKSNDADTLVNLISCSHHLHKQKEMVARYVNQLKSVASGHTFLRSLQDVEGEFDKLATKYKPIQ